MKRPYRATIKTGGMTPRRMISIGFVGALHIVLIWALLNGFAKKVVQYIPPTLVMTQVDNVQAQKPVAPPPAPLVKPAEPQVMPPPIVDIQQPQQAQTIVAPPQPANPAPINVDASASGLTNTHTTPPYPPDARRLGEQGTVHLKIFVGADGSVGDVQIEQSSGYPELDQTAVEWVKAHWRYKPAMQGGIAVPSTTEAAVKFDLKDAR